jgi:glycosyltransferase involved in cell wall biosynthesis
MKIAILGTRGIPARYGGFETFAEELATRLAGRGHSIVVYCRQRRELPTYRDVSLVYLPTVHHKYLDTVVHTFTSTVHILFHRSEVALYCNAANAIFTWMPRLVGMQVALNVDGLERKRKKWNALARGWYLMSERLSTWFPNVTISDAEKIAEYYARRYGKSTECIPYGAEVGKVETDQVLKNLGLARDEYFLYVSRMEPENNALLVREAFERVRTSKKLVLVGDAPYAEEYIRRVRETSDPRIMMPGAIYGTGYHELQSHSFAYIHATEVGGTHPALIEAMGRGALTLYLDTPENAEVARGAGIAFTPETLSTRLQEVLAMTDSEAGQWRRRAMDRVIERYSWDGVTDAYERLFERMLGRQ